MRRGRFMRKVADDSAERERERENFSFNSREDQGVEGSARRRGGSLVRME